MTHRPRKLLELLGGVVTLAAVILCHESRAEDVILHLRNGDRIAGTIFSETTNQVTVTTVWAKELMIPVSQIERRETVTTVMGTTSPTNNPVPPATVAAKTNFPPTATNALPAEKPAVVVITVPPPPPPRLPWFQRWKGEIMLGSDMVRGATDSELYYGKATITYSQPYLENPKEFFRNIFSYSADYGKTDGTLSANDMNGSSKTDFDVSKRIYVYNLGGAGYDEIQKIDLHYEEGPGAGYHLFQGPKFIANVELGANYQVQDRSDGTRTEDFFYRIGEDFTWKINPQMTLTEKFEFFPRADNVMQYRSRFESTLSYALLQNLSLNLSVVDLYDTEPAMGVPNNDFQFRTAVGVKF